MGKKKDPDSTRSDKLLRFYRLLLLNDRKFSTIELTEKLQCSKQTIRSIVDTLNAIPDMHIEEECDEKTRGKRYFIEHHKHGMNEPITLDGFRQMELCRDLIGNVLPKEDLEKLNLAIYNAANYLPRKDRLNFKTLSIAAGFQKGFINYSDCTEQFHALFRCINDKKCCVLEYQKHFGEDIKDYNFAPMLFLCMHDCFYIVGWITEKDKPSERVYDTPTRFSVHRIKAVREIEDSSTVEMPEVNFDSGYFGVIDDSEEFEVILKFSEPYSKTYVADRLWSKEQTITINEDGSILLKFKSKSRYEVISFINSFGDKVEVIAPKDIREEVKSNIQNLVRMYELN